MDTALWIQEPKKPRRSETRQDIRGSAKGPAAAHFDHAGDQPQENHVSQQVFKATV